MTRHTVVTMSVSGPCDEWVSPWMWTVDGPGFELICGTADSDDGAWSQARDVALMVTLRLETHGNALHDAIGGDQ